MLNRVKSRWDVACVCTFAKILKMTKLFRLVALAEGVSYLALFFNMLVIKPSNAELYKTLLYPVGMAHGVLFIGYLILATMLKFEQNWSWNKYLIICAASLLPFATFYMERKYFKAA